MTAWKAGDPVVVAGRQTKTGLITKVGRKYLTVDIGGRERQFLVNNGHQEGQGYGVPDVVYTLKQHADRERHGCAYLRLWNLLNSRLWTHDLTPEQMDAISEIIEKAAKPARGNGESADGGRR